VGRRCLNITSEITMANRHRGEIEAILGGERRTLCLTLGALAELEHAFGAEDMLALAQRFETGRLSARDAIRIIAAGLRGAGGDAGEAEVARMQAEGGAAGYVDIVVRLLGATFGGPGGGSPASGATLSAAASGPGGAGETNAKSGESRNCAAHADRPSQNGPCGQGPDLRAGIHAVPDGNNADAQRDMSGSSAPHAPGESRAPGK
jgi:hypothetical protein